MFIQGLAGRATIGTQQSIHTAPSVQVLDLSYCQLACGGAEPRPPSPVPPTGPPPATADRPMLAAGENGIPATAAGGATGGEAGGSGAGTLATAAGGGAGGGRRSSGASVATAGRRRSLRRSAAGLSTPCGDCRAAVVALAGTPAAAQGAHPYPHVPAFLCCIKMEDGT